MSQSKALRIVTKTEPHAVAGKLPPHDLGLEAAVLANVLKNGTRSLDEILGVVVADDFYSDANANIYAAFVDMAANGQRPDVVSVASWLRDRDRLEKCGGAAYLAQVLDDTPAIANVRKHAAQIAILRRVRKVIGECQRVSAEGYGDIGDPEQWLSQSEGDVARAAARAEDTERMTTAGDALRTVWAATMERLEGKGDPGISTGLHDLDRLLCGLRPGSMTTIGARSHIGKSSLARQIAAHVAGVGPTARKAHGVLLWSGEQPAEECVECMNFQQAGVAEAKRFTKGGFVPEDWASLTQASIELAKAPLLIIDHAAIGPALLGAEIRRAKRKLDKMGWPLALVVVDYVQLMSASGLVERGANREREVSAISFALKQLAMQERVALVVLAQLNKDGDGRKDGRPRPSDLRESNRLEQDSDKVVLIHNPHAVERFAARRDGRDFAMPEHEEVELIVGKSRGGGTMGTVMAGFNPTCGRFWSMTREQ